MGPGARWDPAPVKHRATCPEARATVVDDAYFARLRKTSCVWNRDKWVILFSHPADLTPLCTTELIAFAGLADELEQRNVALLGNSIDSVYSHIAWVRNIKENFGVEIRFPIIADLDTNVAKRFGMVHEASSATAAVRRCSSSTRRGGFER